MFSLPDFMTMLKERASADALWRSEHQPKGAELLRQGARCDEIIALEQGLVKLTYLSQSGDEWIKSFIVDQGLFGSLDEDVNRFGAFAVTDCRIARLPLAWARNRISSDPAFALQVAAFSRWLVARKQEREEALLCDSAEVRYRRMREEQPDLLARLPQGDVARFLRVTPVAFSRIKRRVGGRSG
jgi:CRP-like cAMP-binding protein